MNFRISSSWQHGTYGWLLFIVVSLMWMFPPDTVLLAQESPVVAAIGDSTVTENPLRERFLRLPPQSYSIALRPLLEETAQTFGVEIVCPKKFETRDVALRPWMRKVHLEERLTAILTPLELSWQQVAPNKYEIVDPLYYTRSKAEAKADIERLTAKYTELEPWQNRKTELRRRLLDTLGVRENYQKCDLNPIYTAKREYDGYTVENVAIEVLPGFYTSMSLYRPLPSESGKSSKDSLYPVVLCPHGHSSNNDENKAGRYGAEMQYRCATLARMGAVVLSYSMFAWAEQTLQLRYADHRSTGFPQSIQTLTTKRILDFSTTLPYVDTARVAITGESGGGTQSFLGAALDDRITLAVPVVMVSSHFFGGCPCETGMPIHLVGDGTNNVEITAMIAPRPMLVISITKDWTSEVPEVEYPFLQAIYQLYDAKDKVENVHLDEFHNYGEGKRQALYPFIAKHFALDLSQVDESKVTIEPAVDLKVFGPTGEKLPATAVHGLEKVVELFLEANP